MLDEKKKPFTLTELLVVIATAIFLMAITLPPLARARKYSKLMICTANLKTMGQAMSRYNEDCDDKYPVSWTGLLNGDIAGTNGLPNTNLNCQWHDKRISPEINPGFAGPLWYYIENMSVLLCPTAADYAKRFGQDHPSHDPYVPMEPQYNYSQNYFLGTTNYHGKPPGVLRQSEVVNPDSVLVFTEETFWRIPFFAEWVLNDICFLSRHPDAAISGDTIATYHKTTPERKDYGLGNAVFVDGHVQLNDPWDSITVGGKTYTKSWRLSWPKGNALSETMPY